MKRINWYMFKVGQKLICKANYSVSDMNSIRHHFLIGIEYNIINISSDLTFIRVGFGYSEPYLGCWFPYNDIEQYFYSEKELRAIKLNKLKVYNDEN